MSVAVPTPQVKVNGQVLDPNQLPKIPLYPKPSTRVKGPEPKPLDNEMRLTLASSSRVSTPPPSRVKRIDPTPIKAPVPAPVVKSVKKIPSKKLPVKTEPVIAPPEPEKKEEATPTRPPVKKAAKPAAKPAPKKSMKPNYSAMTEAQQTKERNNFRIRFKCLKDAFPHAEIPFITNESLDDLYDLLAETKRRIVVHTLAMDRYRQYLIIGFLLIELFCCKVLGLKMGGFTVEQIKHMYRYDVLLRELGERQYLGGGAQWPVEVRIGITVLIQAAIFIGISLLSNWLGDAVAGTVKGIVCNMLDDSETGYNMIDKIHDINEETSAEDLDKMKKKEGVWGMLGDIGGTFGNLLGGLGDALPTAATAAAAPPTVKKRRPVPE